MLDQQISRRKLFRNSVLLGAGILLGHGAGGVKILNAQEVKKAKELDISLYIKISTDNTVQLILPNIEMGQGIHTAQAMVIAEELGVNLDNIFVSNAPPLPEYGKRLSTAGSASMNKNFDKLIKIGATAREMLIEAASLEWRVHRDECVAKGGYVSHLSTGRSFSYGELAEKASNLVPPHDPRIKNRKEYQLIGQEIHRIDIPEKVNGSAIYGMDVRLPDMLFAVVKIAPRRGGKLMEFNEDEAMKVKGVKAVVRIPEKRVYLMEFPESIAVVAGSNWQAMKGMERLSPEFSGGNSEEVDDKKIEESFSEILANLDDSDLNANATFRLEYNLPLQAHATLEPFNCTVNYAEDFCEVWGPTQSQSDLMDRLNKLTGLPKEKLKINVTSLGGSFGSKRRSDAFVQAFHISKTLHKPIQLMWTREQDMTCSHYMQMSKHQVQISLGANSYPKSWNHRIACSHSFVQTDHTKKQLIEWGVDPNCIDGFPPAYKLENFDLKYKWEDFGLSFENLRSAGSTQNCFVIESAIDESAHFAGIDPLSYRLGLLDHDERHRRLLEDLGSQSNWKTRLDSGFGRGIAIYEFMVKKTRKPRDNFGSPTTVSAASAVVSVSEIGRLKIEKIYFRVDCGLCVNPNVVRSQIEGGIIMGISLALNEKLSIKEGRVVQANYDEYKIARMKHTPEIEIEIVESDLPPSGTGEPAIAPVIPAITNAIFAATGKRIRNLPIGKQRLI